MKVPAILLAAPFALIAGSAISQTVVLQPQQQRTIIQPVVPQPSATTTTEIKVTPNGTTIEKNQTTKQNLDGSVTTNQTKSVTTP